jgi:hypothetical protein
MFNPVGSDNNQEFIEIYGTNNLSNYIIGDLSSNDSLVLLNFYPNSNYSIIVEEDFNFSFLNCSVYSVGSTIGNGLSNSEDTIFLFFNNSLIDFVSYETLEEGYSYSLIENVWTASQERGGTICQDNFVTSFGNNSYNNSLNITTNSSLENITGNLSECNISINLNIIDDKLFFQNKETIKFSNELSSEDYDYKIEYWITDYFNTTLKSIVETTNTNQKQWTPNIDSKYEIVVLKNKIKQINCTNIGRTNDEKMFIIINNNLSEELNPSSESHITIDTSKISGNFLSVYGEAYKGDTGKQVISFLFQCLNENKKIIKSSEFKIYLEQKYSSQKFSFKLPLKEVIGKCYYNPELAYSGLGLKDEKEVEGFDRSDYKDEIELKQEENDIQEKKNNEENKNESFIYLNKAIEVFTYSANNNSPVINKKFELITQNNSDKKEDSNIETNKVTSNTVKTLGIVSKELTFVNVAVVVLMFSLILIIFFKKW